MNGMIYGFLALWIASVQMVHAAPAASPSDRAYESAQAAFKGKDYTRARTLAQEFSLMYAADPRVPSALLLKGMAELKNNQSAEARLTWQTLAVRASESGCYGACVGAIDGVG